MPGGARPQRAHGKPPAGGRNSPARFPLYCPLSRPSARPVSCPPPHRPSEGTAPAIGYVLEVAQTQWPPLTVAPGPARAPARPAPGVTRPPRWRPGHRSDSREWGHRGAAGEQPVTPPGGPARSSEGSDAPPSPTPTRKPNTREQMAGRQGPQKPGSPTACGRSRPSRAQKDLAPSPSPRRPRLTVSPAPPGCVKGI